MLDLETAALEFKLPEIYNACAHPQAVWFEEHWRPIFIKMLKRIEELEAELDNKRGAMTIEIHRLMKERDALKSRSEKLAECLDVALTLADKDLLTYERQRDHWRNALKEYGKEKYAKEEN